MHLKTCFSKKEHSDAGLALLLLTLIVGLWLDNHLVFRISMAVVVVLLIAPVIIYPFTFLWLNMSDLLGKVISKILLAVIFFLFVCPVALIRKALGKDTLRLKEFKKDSGSVFTERNHTFTKSDLSMPY
jgi:uncharacterized membrane protein